MSAAWQILRFQRCSHGPTPDEPGKWVLHRGRGFVSSTAGMQDNDQGRDRYFELLESCALFRSYQDAFKAATGLPLVILCRSCDPGLPRAEYGNAFCQLLNESGACGSCGATLAEARRQAGGNALTIQCFARMKETIVPVMHAGKVAAYLKTGEVLTAEPGDEDFAHVAAVLLAEGKSGAEIRMLKEAYLKSPVIDGARYQGVVYLLEFFGKQLSAHLGELLVSETEQVPSAVRKALHYIETRLDEPLSLDEVAAHSGLSISQFCKTFKETTGATFTEYVNRRRIEWARRELLRPGSRITEVAYHVGFASLSQFNRSFHRYTGQAPRDYRRGQLVEVG